MSNPTSKFRSEYAQGQAVKKNLKSKVSQGKAVKAKAAKLNKAVVVHLLIFLGMGALLGISVLIPFYSVPEYSLLSFTFVAVALLSLLFGFWHIARANKKIDWFDEGKFSGKFLLTIGVAFVLCLGIVLIYNLVPLIFSRFQGNVNFSISVIIGAATITSTIPFLFSRTFEAAMAIEPKEYALWEYPENYIEKQPTWNRDRIIFANLHFRRKEHENFVTTIKVKLPKEAIFGELIVLFLRDYNENRSPDNPIIGLSKRDGVEGWLFSTDNKGITSLIKKRKLIDTEKTVEENGIQEDGHVYFERILKQES